MKKHLPKSIRSAIAKIKNSMDEIKFLLSDSYRTYLQSTVRGVTGNYSLKVIFSDSICTDGKVISVNPAHEVVGKLATIAKKTLHILGNLAHETFHVKYTDFKALEYMWEKYKCKGEFRVMQLKHIFNIIEDGAVELIGTNYFTGTFRQAVMFKNENYYEHTPTLEELNKNGEPKLSLFMSALTLYSKNGKIKGSFEDSELLELFLKAMPIVDKGRMEKTSYGRLEASIEIFDMIQHLLDEVENDYYMNKRYMEMMSKLIKMIMGSFEGNIKKQSGITPENAPEIKVDFQKENRSGTMEKLQQSKKSKSDEGDEGQQNDPNGKQEEDSGNEGSQDGDEGTEKKENTGNDEDANGDSKGTKPGNEAEPDEDLLNNLQNQLEGVKEDAAEEEFNKEEQKKREEEIRSFASKVKYSHLHRTIGIVIDHVNCEVDENLINLYNSEYEEIANLTKNLTRSMADILTFNEDDVTRNTYTGKLRCASLSRSDKRYCSQKKDKSEESDLVIELLIDESWSMNNNNRKGDNRSGERIKNARLLAMMLEEVCRTLNIPLAIIGHSAIEKQPRVLHQHYVDFSNYMNPKQKYKLAKICAYHNTREGVSLKYGCEYLAKRPETDKILFSITDGQPFHNYWLPQRYQDDLAINDAARVVKEYEKDMLIMGVAIGSDKDEIKQIYTRNYLSVPNITKLPPKLIEFLKGRLLK